MKVIVMKETFVESVKRDVFTVASAWAIILPGWWVGSNALQWVGAILFGLFFLGRMARFQKDNARTVAEAREYLDQLESE